MKHNRITLTEFFFILITLLFKNTFMLAIALKCCNNSIRNNKFLNLDAKNALHFLYCYYILKKLF